MECLKGYAFQGRYKAILVEKENYLLELSRYIVLNPVRAGMTRSARDWPWSSYRATAGQTEDLKCLNVKWILAAFGKRKKSAIDRYKTFISEGKGQASPWKLLQHQVYLDTEAFVEKMQSFIDEELSEIPSSQRRPKAKQLSY